MAELAIDEYLSTTRSLWPSGPGSRAAPGAVRSMPRVRRCSCSRTATTPRLLVPAGNPRAAVERHVAVQCRRHARVTLRSGWPWLRPYAPGRPWWFPDRISVPNDRDSLGEHLASTVFGHDVELSLGLGTARREPQTRPPGVRPAGAERGFRQAGSQRSNASRRGRRGSRSAQRADVGPLPGLESPGQLIHDGPWGEIRVVVMSALNTSMWQRPAKDPHPPTTAMQVLHEAFHEGRLPLTQSAVWQRLLVATDTVTDSQTRVAPDGRARSDWRRLPADGPSRSARGTATGHPGTWPVAGGASSCGTGNASRPGCPTDSTSATTGSTRSCRRDGIRLTSVLAGLSSVGFDRAAVDDERRVVAGTYLATITCRYLLSAQGDFGERITDASQVMLDALCIWVGSPRTAARLAVMSSQVVQPGDGCGLADGGVGPVVVVVVQQGW